MMTPYYQDDWATLYHGDCFKVLPALRGAALIVTDPPYGLSYNEDDLTSKREAIFGGKKASMRPNSLQRDGEQEANTAFYKLVKLSKTVLIPGGVLASCCVGGGGSGGGIGKITDPRFHKWVTWMAENLTFMMAVVWDKGGLGMGLRYRRNYEFILLAQKGAPLHCWNGGHSEPNVWRIPRIIPKQSRSQHPTEKPAALFERIIHNHSNPGDLIVDPFAGSGAAIIAAQRMGRRAVGIEIDPKWCYEIRKRLRGASTYERGRRNKKGGEGHGEACPLSLPKGGGRSTLKNK